MIGKKTARIPSAIIKAAKSPVFQSATVLPSQYMTKTIAIASRTGMKSETVIISAGVVAWTIIAAIEQRYVSIGPQYTVVPTGYWLMGSNHA